MQSIYGAYIERCLPCDFDPGRSAFSLYCNQNRTKLESGPKTTDVAQDLALRLMDEASKLMRGLTFVGLDPIRGAADVLNKFTDEVSERNRTEGEAGSKRRTITRLTADLPGGMFAAVFKATDRLLDIPSPSADDVSFDDESYAEVSDATVEQNNRFWYTLIRELRTANDLHRHRHVIILLHGLNEVPSPSTFHGPTAYAAPSARQSCFPP